MNRVACPLSLLAATGLGLVVFSAPALAQGKAKPRAEPAPRNGAIVVTNRRDSTLLELIATPQKGGGPIVIARDVGAGAKAVGKLPKNAGCVFSLAGTFDDQSSTDAANVNLCKDGRINLLE